ncbi:MULTISPECIES: (Fe-S)-binding protein [Desulfosporosinus]|uniref:Succinate dehydrogenase/fumarate reductase iron-sulfur subunit n=1 Tax=Desulfosporosinus acididurans TaxID=476652 RepID=A0A0J1FLH0_9FIRM|nr:MULTISPECIES: (Fe-S)-binding protein [Desulfosporosinus]KLU64207.1 succinate dehydrogenase/fumarate reductase iron-sulfur subunit [Desulfosporosinus acididurans]
MGEPIRVKSLDPTLRHEIAGILKKYDFSNCLTCGMCTAGCIYSDLHEDQDPRKFIRKVALGMREEAENDPFVWNCTMCERCTVECPMGVNIAAITRAFRGKTPVPPGHLQVIADDHIRTGNQMGVEQIDYIETLEWIEELLQAQLKDPSYKIPLDKPNADFMFCFNAREIKHYPADLQTILHVFHAAKANYTISTKRWDATNICLFTGKDDEFCEISRPLFEEAQRLNPKEIIVTECGHAFRSTRQFARNYWDGKPIPVRHIVEIYADWIKEGKLKLDKTKNTVPVTMHDPCNTVRKEGVYEPQRYVIKNTVMDYREMNPEGKYNICCGAGGGALAVAATKQMRMIKAKPKVDQLVATGAKIGCIPCHNCIDQFNDMNKFYKLGMKMEHLSALVENALIEDIPEDAPEETSN